MWFLAWPLRIRLTRDSVGRNLRKLNTFAECRKAFELKYAEKLKKRLKKEGLSDLKELKDKIYPQVRPPQRNSSGDQRLTTSRQLDAPLRNLRERMDSSSVKPLHTIMDIQKAQADLTAEQISGLWTTYHTTISQGARPGYLSATIPLPTYVKMSSRAARYPTFVLPLQSPVLETGDRGHKFYFLEWTFQGNHPPHHGESKFGNSTILVTPLQEYKARKTFATPYLVLTHYTDLAISHGIVLLRGEITYSLSSPRPYLSQTDAQLLASGVQRLYLAPDSGGSARLAELLQEFHEAPQEFHWEDLLEFADPTALE